MTTYGSATLTLQVLIIIMLACNGIRHDPKENKMEAMHRKLVKTLEVYETVRFVLCGCIPNLVYSQPF